MQSSFTVGAAKDGQRLTFKWVVFPSNRDTLGKVLEMGSVSCFPSTRSSEVCS
jgi:hypothetical protein